jgi:release factor glutamine methyltransferase
MAPFAPQKARYDVIVSNPPYIPSGDIDGLQPEIFRFEPRAALDGGLEGLDCLALIIETAPTYLKAGGGLFLEIGHDQYPAVRQLADTCGAYADLACRKDYSGHDRVACMVKA